MSNIDVAGWSPPAKPERHAGRIFFWILFAVIAALLVGGLALLIATTRQYSIPSTSMENTLRPGDRVLATLGSGAHRGDVIIFRQPVPGPGSRGPFGISHNLLYVRRLIGLPGDHVACCDAGGRVTVNGEPLAESYVYPGDPPSEFKFSVALGKGQIWILGDHRSISYDSQERGPARASDIVGRVFLIDRGGRFITVHTPATFISDGLAPASAGSPLPIWKLIEVGASAVALLLLGVVGITRFLILRRHARRDSVAYYAI